MREGSPLVIGVGIGENFISSDQLALLPVTNRFVYLEEGDIARLTRNSIEVFVNGEPVLNVQSKNWMQPSAMHQKANISISCSKKFMSNQKRFNKRFHKH